MANKGSNIEFDCRNEEDDVQVSSHSADWDDSVLVRAYDKAMNKAHAEIARKINSGSTDPMSDNKSKTKYQKARKKAKDLEKWKVGEFCQAVYSEDGVTYEAVIIDLNESGGTCVVCFIGYENEEVVAIDSLLPSQGRSSRLEQEQMARSEIQERPIRDDESATCSEEDSVRSRYGSKHTDRNYQHFSGCANGSMPAPPFGIYSPSHAPTQPLPSAIPPPFMTDQEGSEDDKLYSMLLSWYMSGYHTGFYLGSRQRSRSRNSCDCSHECH